MEYKPKLEMVPFAAVCCTAGSHLREGTKSRDVGFHLAPLIGPSRSKFDVAPNLCRIISPSFVADKKAVDRLTDRAQTERNDPI